MRQVVNIKKVSIDADHKVSVLIEFLSTTRESRDNVFSLIELQGEAVEAAFSLTAPGMVFHSADSGSATGMAGI